MFNEPNELVSTASNDLHHMYVRGPERCGFVQESDVPSVPARARGMGGAGAGAAAGGVLAAELCAPLLLLCWLCCWNDDASSGLTRTHTRTVLVQDPH